MREKRAVEGGGDQLSENGPGGAMHAACGSDGGPYKGRDGVTGRDVREWMLQHEQIR